MGSVKIGIEISEEILKFMDKNQENYSKKVKELFLYQFIKDEKISFGKAAEIMGLSKLEYMKDLGEMGIPYFNSSIEDVLNDVKSLDELMEEK